jgi:hypothetical protein
MRKLACLLLIAAASWVPSETRAALPQCTLQCPCSIGGPCVCGPDGCSCGPGCRCTTCPGKSQRVGIAQTADDAIRSAAAYGCPLIAFVNQPARPVTGAISYRVDRKDSAEKRTWAGSASTGTYLPAGATDAELLTAALPHLPRRMPSFGCPGGVCR